MVRGQQGHAAAVKQKFFQRQVTIKIHVVKVHDGQHAGIRALAVEMKLDIDALKRMLQRLGNQAARPFIEVADDQPRVLELGRQQNLTAHQQTGLLATLNVSRAQMNVEEMDDSSRSDFQITANTAAGLTT